MLRIRLRHPSSSACLIKATNVFFWMDFSLKASYTVHVTGFINAKIKSAISFDSLEDNFDLKVFVLFVANKNSMPFFFLFTLPQKYSVFNTPRATRKGMPTF